MQKEKIKQNSQKLKEIFQIIQKLKETTPTSFKRKLETLTDLICDPINTKKIIENEAEIGELYEFLSQKGDFNEDTMDAEVDIADLILNTKMDISVYHVIELLSLVPQYLSTAKKGRKNKFTILWIGEKEIDLSFERVIQTNRSELISLVFLSELIEESIIYSAIEDLYKSTPKGKFRIVIAKKSPEKAIKMIDRFYKECQHVFPTIVYFSPFLPEFDFSQILNCEKFLKENGMKNFWITEIEKLAIHFCSVFTFPLDQKNFVSTFAFFDPTLFEISNNEQLFGKHCVSKLTCVKELDYARIRKNQETYPLSLSNFKVLTVDDPNGDFEKKENNENNADNNEVGQENNKQIEVSPDSVEKKAAVHDFEHFVDLVCESENRVSTVALNSDSEDSIEETQPKKKTLFDLYDYRGGMFFFTENMYIMKTLWELASHHLKDSNISFFRYLLNKLCLVSMNESTNLSLDKFTRLVSWENNLKLINRKIFFVGDYPLSTKQELIQIDPQKTAVSIQEHLDEWHVKYLSKSASDLDRCLCYQQNMHNFFSSGFFTLVITSSSYANTILKELREDIYTNIPVLIYSDNRQDKNMEEIIKKYSLCWSLQKQELIDFLNNL
ncbi:hypothetical protein M0811_08290 [Anaeramoeba ignava]|uniref:Uncharacterized protein n=1 Tax=Anaeramoeba ignava TaxID=1746090 RepID=A0A9Q0LJB9_ANAIG|nr:hypothetical protein M0811_08290 [Anaeramoeba ignava]